MSEEKVVIPTLKNLRKSLSDMSVEELDKVIGNVRADRRRIISDQGKIKRKGKKVTKKKKSNVIDLMTKEERAEMKAFLEGELK